MNTKPPPAYAAFRKARVILANIQHPLQLSDVPRFLEVAAERLASIPRPHKKVKP